MTPARLILFEGLPGSGKTTTAQQVWLGLEALGRPARWWFEHELGHPILDYEQARRARAPGSADAKLIFERAQAGWRTLAGQLRAGGETVILEGTLFQTTVGTQLLMDLPRAEIAAHFDRTMEIIARLAPALVCLWQPAASAALRRACAHRQPWFEEFLLREFAATVRGQRLGRAEFADVEAYFDERQAVSAELMERWPGPKLVHDNADGDWARQRRAVEEFLGLPPGRKPAPPAGVGDFTGRYRAETGDELRVAEDGQGLYLADEAGTRLLPHGPDAFVVQALCVELVFDRDPAGAVLAISCRGALPGLAPHWPRVSAD